MRNSDTFYFLKVELGIDSCEEVTAIERMKHGTEYLWLWIRLALKYANYGGVLCKRIGEVVIPVFLGNGQALHGSYNADKSAQVASMYIGGYPNLCYYRIGGDTCYTQFLNDIAHANGGRAGWLEGITFPLG